MRPFVILTYLCVKQLAAPFIPFPMLDLIGQHMSIEHTHTTKNDACSQLVSQWGMFGRWITAYLISISTYAQIDFSSVQTYSLVGSRLHTNMNYVNCERVQTNCIWTSTAVRCPRRYLSNFQSDAGFHLKWEIHSLHCSFWCANAARYAPVRSSFPSSFSNP